MTKKIVIAVGLVLALAFGALSWMMGGPKDAYGFLRYAAPQWRAGELKVGDKAPDVQLLSLDGRTRFSLREKVGPKPLVLIFGSYT